MVAGQFARAGMVIPVMIKHHYFIFRRMAGTYRMGVFLAD
jgi:hypothetical protein